MEMLNDLGMLVAQALAEDDSWRDIIVFGAGFLLGGALTYVMAKFEKETSGEIAKARKEGYDSGRKIGEEKGKEAYRDAVRATMGENCAGVSRASESGDIVEIPINKILDECDERSGYEG